MYFFQILRTKGNWARLALVFVLVAVLVAGFIARRAFQAAQKDAGTSASISDADTREFTVAGGSMEPILADGQTIRVHTSAYDGAPIGRGDIILIEQPGNNGYLVKFVKAIPGDTLELSEQADGTSQVIINNETLANSAGEPYALSEAKAAMLGLYSRDYGAIPEGAYFVLGNRPAGSDDSTIFGLIDAGRIKGRVLTE